VLEPVSFKADVCVAMKPIFSDTRMDISGQLEKVKVSYLKSKSFGESWGELRSKSRSITLSQSYVVELTVSYSSSITTVSYEFSGN
jgi:hypothetical protein